VNDDADQTANQSASYGADHGAAHGASHGANGAVRAAAASVDRPESFLRVTAVLAERGHPHAPCWLDSSARTAQEAADLLGVAVGQIAKSVIFRRRADDAAVLVITSGDRRVDDARVAHHTGALGRADAEFVKARTGFSIGGVAPLAHLTETLTLIDRDLFRFDEIWAAAGHPNGVFKLSPRQLASLTGAPVADVVQTAIAQTNP